MKKKIMIHLQGGMGNQFFIWALGTVLAKRNPEFNVIFDTEDFHNGYKRPFVLGRLCVQNFRQLGNSHRVFSRIVRNFYRCFFRYKETKPFIAQDIDFSHMRKVYVDGYWQSEKYFIQNKQCIMDAIKLNDANDKKGLEEFVQAYGIRDRVSIHIRRTDYIGGGCLVDDTYYTDAICFLEGKFGKLKYAVFSDDIGYAREMECLKSKDAVFVGKEMLDDDLISMFAMSTCMHHIITNSSYSWWAAWLDDKADKIVIAPECDYLRGTDFYPKNWKLIPAVCS